MVAIKVGHEDGTESILDLTQGIKVGESVQLKNEEGTVLLTLEASIISPEKLYRNADWLRNAYLKENKTMQEIGALFNVSAMTICTWLDKHEIETRSRGRRS